MELQEADATKLEALQKVQCLKDELHIEKERSKQFKTFLFDVIRQWIEQI